MRVTVNQPIKGYRRESYEAVQDWSKLRIHANEGDTLHVLFINLSHYICESKYYEGEHVIVFHNQCKNVEKEQVIPIEEIDIEKYYNVYEEPSNTSLDDPFYSAFEFEDNE